MSSGSYKDFSNVVHIRSSAIKAFYGCFLIFCVLNDLMLKYVSEQIFNWYLIRHSIWKIVFFFKPFISIKRCTKYSRFTKIDAFNNSVSRDCYGIY